ncbi:hypothetical protein BDY21DRAFT_20424 [Lineolata rhizophorae]|uniref:Uncharacterized protein n=1 Tax=Lineolata rhizophorae TaxID=578093 RepID=A0A6A6P2G4_9PEZI|nr:hypothetical protein BDY21DRAFT_20424 [Lineolata rhizophorae]
MYYIFEKYDYCAKKLRARSSVVERSLCMREVQDSISCRSKIHFADLCSPA